MPPRGYDKAVRLNRRKQSPFVRSSTSHAIFHARDDVKAMAAMKRYWLVKQEPEAYSWSDFVRDGLTNWTGVRNFQARNNLRAMRKGDAVLFYHSVSDKAVVGIAQVTREAFPDPTAEEGDWSAVEIKPVKALRTPVTLEQIKAEPRLGDIALLRNSRLSVQPLGKVEFELICRL
jgi:predicted RNA-binding protein with PUA-like domain